MSAWHVVATKPGQDDLAARTLREAGFRTFAPWRWKRVSHARTVQRRPRPVFSGYVFFLAEHQPWQAAARCRGVREVITLDHQKPAKIPTDWLIQHQELCTSDGYMQHADEIEETALPIINVGDVLKVLDGPFAGLVATVMALDKKGAPQVMAEMFGTERPVTLSPQRVEAMASP